ncbi:hypothetical protein [Glycomyces tritici]|uniref:Lipoprotein n=1 Tax=Glycomyces tritici TaxID=2665176 RepID=A0ABT7YMS3_9ACTN|nr:hypothetical protein [Glycomyces tritici]MDN3239911.1 hypothetical protein [Glycomyces tritici]
MRLAVAKTATAAAALLLALAACSEDAGGNNDGTGDGGEDPVFAAMKTWDACEVLDNLQPITEFMGIEGYGSLTSAGGAPATREYDTTWSPDAIGCGNLIYLGSYEGLGMDGEIKVSIIPAEDEDQASTAYADRAGAAESNAAGGQDTTSSEIGDPWDEGVMHSWIEGADNPHVEIIARDGQWVFQIVLYHSADYGLGATGEPALQFTDDELNQWFIDTYLPEVNQAVNDKIAEVQ